MFRGVTINLLRANKPLLFSNTRGFTSAATLLQSPFPFGDTAKDALRSFPNSKAGSNNVGLNIPFKSTAQGDKIQNAAKDSSNILPEQIREEAASLMNYSTRSGRTVTVTNGDTASACRRLGGLVFANQIAIDRRKQRFHMKPGKKAELKRSMRHRKDFMKGFKRLMEVVKDAKRKGY